MISSFNASPSYIQPGQATTLTWSVSNADTVSISPSVGSVSSSGSYIVSPGSTTAYTLSATGDSTTRTAGTMVTVATNVFAFSGSNTGGYSGSSNNVYPAEPGGSNYGGINSWLLYVVLIGLLATASAVIVYLLLRKPVAVRYAGGQTVAASQGTAMISTAAANISPVTAAVVSGHQAQMALKDGGIVSLRGVTTSSLGRDNFKSLMAPDKSRFISRQHVLVSYENGQYYLEDRSSTNGTRVNGIEIRGTGRQAIKNNDVIDLADVLSMIFKE